MGCLLHLVLRAASLSVLYPLYPIGQARWFDKHLTPIHWTPIGRPLDAPLEPGTREQRAKEATHGSEGEGAGAMCSTDFKDQCIWMVSGLHMCPVLEIECEAAKQAEAVQEQLRQFEKISGPSGSKENVRKLAKAPAMLLVPDRVSCGCKSSERLSFWSRVTASGLPRFDWMRTGQGWSTS